MRKWNNQNSIQIYLWKCKSTIPVCLIIHTGFRGGGSLSHTGLGLRKLSQQDVTESCQLSSLFLPCFPMTIWLNRCADSSSRLGSHFCHLFTELLDFGFMTFFSGIFKFRLHVIPGFYLTSCIAGISPLTGVSVSIRVFCRFRPPDVFLGPALGMGLSFSSVTGDDWQDSTLATAGICK